MFIDKIFLKFYIYVHRRAVIKSIMIYKGVAFTILGGSQHSLFARMPDDTRLLLTYTYTEQNEQQNLSYGYNPPQLYTTHATWIPTLLQESLLPLQPDVAVMGSCFVVGSLLPCRVRKRRQRGRVHALMVVVAARASGSLVPGHGREVLQLWACLSGVRSR